MTEEEREKARAWRHGAMNRDKGEFCWPDTTVGVSEVADILFHRSLVDLASIARTSGAFSQSPPTGDSLLGSSPVNMRAVCTNHVFSSGLG